MSGISTFCTASAASGRTKRKQSLVQVQAEAGAKHCSSLLFFFITCSVRMKLDGEASGLLTCCHDDTFILIPERHRRGPAPVRQRQVSGLLAVGDRQGGRRAVRPPPKSSVSERLRPMPRRGGWGWGGWGALKLCESLERMKDLKV